MKVLIIEDDNNVVEAISLSIELRWPESKISSANEGVQGIEMVKSDSFDIVILDINLPDITGFNVLEQIRSFSIIPVIILSVRDEEEDRARGLETGADDYIIKPFSPRDVIARITAVTRRAAGRASNIQQTQITKGKLVLDLTKDEVSLRGKIIQLTRNESKLLYTLMDKAQQTVNPENISREIWGAQDVNMKNIRSYIRKLRIKLNDKPPQIILSEHGWGYRFVIPT